MPITPNPPADYTPTMGNYKELRPFRFWCQKVLPLVYDDSLSYYELLCKVVDYLNKTMEDVDTLHTDVENLHTAYEELQAYVNSYFSTLDVQEEINNKLDEMTEDGTLTALISAYVDPIYEAYEEEINTQIATQNTTLNTQNSRLAVLETRMDGFTRLAEGTTTLDAEIIDARIGVDGTVYNNLGTAIRTQIGNIDDTLNVYINQLDYSTASGYVNYQTGAEATSDFYVVTDYIECDSINVGVNTYVENDYSGICFYDVNKNFISGYNPYANNNTLVEIVKPNNAYYVRISCRVGHTNVLKVVLARTSDILLRLNNIVSKTINPSRTTQFTNNKYIKYSTGEVIDIENPIFYASDYVDISRANEVDIYTAFVSQAGLAFYDKEYGYISGIGYESGYAGLPHNYAITNIPDNAKYLRFSLYANTMNLSDYSLDIYTSIETLKEGLDTLDEEVNMPVVYDVNYIQKGYIRALDGKLILYDNADFYYTDFIDISCAKKITVCTALVSGAGLAFYDKDKVFISGTTFAPDFGGKKYNYNLNVPNGAIYVRYSMYTVNMDLSEAYLHLFITNQTLVSYINSKTKDTDFWSYALWKVLCIGDSLTSGANYTDSWAGASIDENYPRILGRMLGADVVNAGVSGITAQNWYNNQSDNYDYADYDTFIIWLGTNAGLTDTLDTDVDPYSDYRNYANTNTGCYCKIIEKIKESNNNCLILLTKVFVTSGAMGVDTVNSVIEQIATKYGLPIIDNSELNQIVYPELHGNIDNVHFSKAGNIYLARKFVKDIGVYIGDNPLRADYGETPRSN